MEAATEDHVATDKDYCLFSGHSVVGSAPFCVCIMYTCKVASTCKNSISDLKLIAGYSQAWSMPL